MVASVFFFLHWPLFSHPKSATQEGRSTRNVLLPFPSSILSLRHFQWVSHGPCSSVKDVTDRCTLTGSADYPFFSAVTTLFHCCSVANMAWDPLVSVGQMLTISGSGSRRKLHFSFILHVSLQVYRKPVSIFTTYPLPAEVQMFSGMMCL